jgi:hypothetical protein
MRRHECSPYRGPAPPAAGDECLYRG